MLDKVPGWLSINILIWVYISHSNLLLVSNWCKYARFIKNILNFYSVFLFLNLESYFNFLLWSYKFANFFLLGVIITHQLMLTLILNDFLEQCVWSRVNIFQLFKTCLFCFVDLCSQSNECILLNPLVLLYLSRNVGICLPKLIWN